LSRNERSTLLMITQRVINATRYYSQHDPARATYVPHATVIMGESWILTEIRALLTGTGIFLVGWSSSTP
jgi:hypothetical protein